MGFLIYPWPTRMKLNPLIIPMRVYIYTKTQLENLMKKTTRVLKA